MTRATLFYLSLSSQLARNGGFLGGLASALVMPRIGGYDGRANIGLGIAARIVQAAIAEDANVIEPRAVKGNASIFAHRSRPLIIHLYNLVKLAVSVAFSLPFAPSPDTNNRSFWSGLRKCPPLTISSVLIPGRVP